MRDRHVHENGSVNQALPLFLAFGFFAILSIGSIIFLAGKNRQSSVVTNPISASGNSSSVVPGQGSNPFQKQSPNPHQQPSVPLPQNPPPSPFSNKPSNVSPNPGPGKALTQQDAVDVINKWFKYKPTIFSDPYDTSKLQDYLCRPGKLYLDITRKGGSIDWLKTNQSSYRYKDVKIKNVKTFDLLTADKAVIELSVFEDLELVTPSGVDKSRSSKKTQSYEYDLEKQGGIWKICNYRKI